MRMRMTPEASVALIQPTVGWEGELHQIVFAIITNKKVVSLSDDDPPSMIFEPTETGVYCVNDNSNENLNDCLPVVKNVAKQKRLAVSSQFRGLHVLEFITSPTKKTDDLHTQFAEISRLEADLIQYIIQKKEKNELIELICIKDWMDDYNRRFKEAPLVGGNRTHEMYILVDHSLKKIKESVKKFSMDVQSQLKHAVQFNFVSALGKKMGSELISIYKMENEIEEYAAFKEKKALEYTIISLKLEALQKQKNQEARIQEHQKQLSVIIEHKILLECREKQIHILQEAENNSEKICELIRHQSASERKLTKLTGFFFLLSMRIMTEVDFIPLWTASSIKNRYIYFLKTNLSDLIHSLSENDKKILQDMSAWGDAEKQQLFVLIAGSSEALTVSFHINQTTLTVKEVIESALGWEKNKMCDLLPNSPTKPIEMPLEPVDTQIRRETHLRRILLENRSLSDKTIIESENEMKKMLYRAAGLSKTTYLQKKYEIPSESQTIEFKQTDTGTIIDNTIRKAMMLIDEYKTGVFDEINFKLQLSKIVFHSDKDITLKQINYLYLKMPDRNPAIDKIVTELYAEKIATFFPFPLKAEEKQYMEYVSSRYFLSKEIPDISEYLNFVKTFSIKFPNSFEVALVNKNHNVGLIYRIKPGVDINSKVIEGKTELHYACQFGLKKLIDLLLQQRAVARSEDIVSCLDNEILTVDLVDKLMKAGADMGEALCRLAKEKDDDSIKKMIEIIGTEASSEAIQEYAYRPDVRAYYDYLQVFLTAEHKELPTPMSHSVMFPVKESQPSASSTAEPTSHRKTPGVT